MLCTLRGGQAWGPEPQMWEGEDGDWLGVWQQEEPWPGFLKP
jgi:hypothetical protein